MNRILAAIATVLILAGVGLGQGVAESALTHALSTTTATTVGKALGNATNQMTNQVAGRVQTVPVGTPRPVSNAKAKEQKRLASMTTTDAPAGGSMIQSIQGSVAQNCRIAAAGTENQKAEAAKAGSATTDAAVALVPARAGEGICPSTTNAYPSVITLAAPK
jgi:hypothetical protein